MNLTEDHVKAFTYVIHWSKFGISYYGVKYSENCRTGDLWTKYFTSSHEVRKFREQYGEPDLVMIDQQFLNVREALSYEAEILQENDVRNNPNYLNKIDGQAPYIVSGVKHPRYGKELPEEIRTKISKTLTGRKVPTETRLKVSDSMKGEKNHFFNKRHSGEAKEKISKSNRNNTMYVFHHKEHGYVNSTIHDLHIDFDIKYSGRIALMVRGVDAEGFVVKSHKGWTYHGAYEPTE